MPVALVDLLAAHQLKEVESGQSGLPAHQLAVWLRTRSDASPAQGSLLEKLSLTIVATTSAGYTPSIVQSRTLWRRLLVCFAARCAVPDLCARAKLCLDCLCQGAHVHVSLMAAAVASLANQARDWADWAAPHVQWDALYLAFEATGYLITGGGAAKDGFSAVV